MQREKKLLKEIERLENLLNFKIEEINIIREISALIIDSTNFREIARIIELMVSQKFGYKRTTIFLYNETEEVIVSISNCTGLSQSEITLPLKKDSKMLSGEFLATKRSFFFPLFARGRFVGALEIEDQLNTRDYLKIKKDTYNIFNLDLLLKKNPGFELLVIFVNQIAILLDNMYAYEKIKQNELNLKRSNSLLRRSNQELDDFTYIVSHDLKEPLRGISNFCQYLMEDYSRQLDKKACHYLDVIKKSSARMKKLIDDLLKLSHVRRKSNSSEELNLNRALKEIIQNMEPAIKEKKVKIKIQKDLPTITCDSLRYKQVFYNLVNNAIKYADKAKPYIKIGWRQTPAEHIFTIKDNGPGISKEDYDKIFTIFRRLHHDKNEGTGAGLTIVKTIVESHGGRIWVESELGHGSVFYFTCPKVQIEDKGK